MQFELQDPETYTPERLAQVATQPRMTQLRYLDRLQIRNMNINEVNQLQFNTNLINQPQQAIFKHMLMTVIDFRMSIEIRQQEKTEKRLQKEEKVKQARKNRLTTMFVALLVLFTTLLTIFKSTWVVIPNSGRLERAPFQTQDYIIGGLGALVSFSFIVCFCILINIM